MDAKEIRFGAEGSRPAGKDSIKSGAKCIYARFNDGPSTQTCDRAFREGPRTHEGGEGTEVIEHGMRKPHAFGSPHTEVPPSTSTPSASEEALAFRLSDIQLDEIMRL